MLLSELLTTLQNSIKDRQVTQVDLANILEVTRATISKRIKTNSEVTVSELQKIQDYFEVSLLPQRDQFPTQVINRGIEVDCMTIDSGERINLIAKFNGLIEEEMAVIMEIPFNRYKKLINGELPTIQELNKIKSNFNVSTDDILYDERGLFKRLKIKIEQDKLEMEKLTPAQRIKLKEMMKNL